MGQVTARRGGGGPQPGSGRPKGSKTRATPRDVALDLLTATVSDGAVSLTHRIHAAEVLLRHTAKATAENESVAKVDTANSAMRKVDTMFKDV